MAQHPLQVLILAYQGLNILDLCGPSEVFANFALGPRASKITVAASDEQVKSFEGVTVQRDRDLKSLLAITDEAGADPHKTDEDLPTLSDYDLLIIPGGPGDRVQTALDKDPDLLSVLQQWSEIHRSTPTSPPNENTTANPWRTHKPLLSICTGAAFPGHLTLLSAKTCTTHFGYIPTLHKICHAAGPHDANIVRKRFVDAGATDTGMRILTSGGISCGIDASLWVLGQMVGWEEAKGVAKTMDYRWGFDRTGKVTEGEVV